jgi:hypothetical protein
MMKLKELSWPTGFSIPRAGFRASTGTQRGGRPRIIAEQSMSDMAMLRQPPTTSYNANGFAANIGERQMFLWWSVFVAPFAASTLEWVVLSSRRRDQLRHFTVILAIAFSTMAAWWGIWTLLHFPGMLLAPRAPVTRLWPRDAC